MKKVIDGVLYEMTEEEISEAKRMKAVHIAQWLVLCSP